MLNVGLALFPFSSSSALAGVHYVDVSSTNATPPYTNWATAATNIQAAVNTAVTGDEVVVTNGIYSPVYVDKPLVLRSVNGPQSSIIDGQRISFEPCAVLTSGTSLSGFTLTGGYVDSAVGGAGVYCESATAVVSNCIVTDNYTYNNDGGGAYGGTLNNCTLNNNLDDYGSGGGAAYCTLNNCTLTGNSALRPYYPSDARGGGAYECTLNNCTLTFNSAIHGGGAAFCTLNNCTLIGNSASGNDPFFVAQGGGTYYGTLNNCIVYGNSLPNSEGTNSYGSVLNYCWTTPLPAPLFVDQAGGNLRLQSRSPCINGGNNSYVTNTTDLDGNPRIAGGTVDIGAYEFQWPQLTITRSGPNVLLRWPTNNAGYDYTGFTLQSTTNLFSPAVWSTNSPAPVVIGGQNVIINPISGPQQFYRLRQ
jgi:hypothetical protein